MAQNGSEPSAGKSHKHFSDACHQADRKSDRQRDYQRIEQALG
jgi:hypothetical protein